MLISRPAPLWAPDGTAGGGAPPADPAPGSTTTEGAEGTAEPQQDGGLFDQVDGDAPPGKDGRPQRPGWLAEQFWDGERGEPKVEALAKSQRDLRAMIARGEHKPPASADAYAVPAVEGVADPLALIGGKDDPVWREVRGAAHAAGVSQVQLSAIMGPVLAAMVARGGDGEQRQDDPAAEAEAIAEARRAELGRLGPNGTQLVRQTGAWLNGLAARGLFTEGEVRALRGVGTAEGVRALAKLRELSGEQAIPVDALAADGDMTQADAERLMVEGFAGGDQAKVEKGRKALAALERRGALRVPGGR